MGDDGGSLDDRQLCARSLNDQLLLPTTFRRVAQTEKTGMSLNSSKVHKLKRTGKEDLCN